MIKVAAIVGPTAAGKSAVALALAERTDADLVSVDSMQVYRRMDIGTAKPSLDDQERVRHHMIDIVDPSEAYSVAEFREEARTVIGAARRPVMVVGGSGLHFRAVVDPLEFAPTDPEVRSAVELLEPEAAIAELIEIDPDATAHLDVKNPRRVTRALEIARLTGLGPSTRATGDAARAVQEYRPLLPVVVVGVDPGDDIAGAIELRVDRMLAEGLVDEVASVMDDWGATASQAVGYKQIAASLRGEYGMDEARERTLSASMALVKRQRTFFRRDPRITWLHRDRSLARAVSEAGRVFEEAGWNS